MSFDEDDDLPPPLASLPGQLDAVRQREDAPSTSQQDAPQLRTATCVVDGSVTGHQGQGSQEPSKPKAIKKGFFDAKPAAKKPPERKAKADTADSIPTIKAQKPTPPGSGPNIPDFLRLPPDASEEQYKKMRTELVDALKPDRDTIDNISKNADLMKAFDDPEVMAAVSDIAENPQNFKKYQNNPKVKAFYASMGSLMGQRLDSMAATQQNKASKS